MKLVQLAIIILFSSTCYSADWGSCKLSSYFYTSPIESLDVYFHSPNKLSIDFNKGSNYWGVSFFKINKDDSNALLKNYILTPDRARLDKLVYKNYVHMLEQDIFHIVKKTEEFIIPTIPVTFGYLINAMIDPEVSKNSELRDFSIAIQEYDDFIILTKVGITSEGKLPPISEIKEVILQFRNSCIVNEVSTS